jgi:hypothetical protein
MYIHSLFSKLLKDPLLHFLLIGLGLFFLFSQLNSEEEKNDTQQIIIDKSTLNILSDAFIKDKGRAPTQKEMQVLLEEDIREEILYQEALLLGLDKEDRVIRHRLAQKTKYLFEDVALLDDPSDDELKVFFNKNTNKYLDSSGALPKYSKLKSQLKRAWIAQEQKKENDAFYKDLKSRYKVIMNVIIPEDLNVSTKQ